ncbi:DNA topoisomerase 6 subunit B [Pleodorina starrii]|uniref:DNA topoisomerase 6 subunit B n=1 Tax=Pleodorina starrii TaxID=330485 RepID=A0A9W6BTA1_9CHLO|nr:DNA topoisomerase 6 subunit B [Pleodorina starrii]
MAPKAKADALVQKSPAEFFAENKNIAGFDNPGKCLYTTIRELVENALDAAESISELPVIEITIEEVSKARLNRIRGVEEHGRLDEQLYQDFESEEAKKKRLAKEAKDKEKLQKLIEKHGEGAAAVETKRKELAAAAAAAAAGGGGGGGGGKAGGGMMRGTLFYKVTVKDNGAGMPHRDIPDMLGRVLSGTKYGVKQTRGKFGLGAKMALIWSKMTTGLPFEICSARRGSSSRSHYVLDIDIHRNEPNVHKEELLPNPDHWHGSVLSLTIEGNWQYYRSKIVRYLRQIAVITPYAHFCFNYRAEDEKNSMRINFRRRTDVMPPPPPATKHHPSSVDLELVKRLIAATPTTTLTAFLRKDFDCVSPALAERLVEEMQAGVEGDMSPKKLTDKQIVRLHQLLHEVRFDDPKGDHLSPAGEYNLRLGVMKELSPDMIATHQGDVRVFEGHAFIVEAAVSVGGRDIKPGINVHRFANRIPLLFEGGSDVITKTALKRVNWGAYKINQNTDKVGVFVSIVSTKIPFKGAGKEYIGDDVEEMVGAVKSAIQACCVQLKAKIVRAIAAREQKQRKRNLTKYISDVANSVFSVLERMAAARGTAAAGGSGGGGEEGQEAAAAKRRRLEVPDEKKLLPAVASQELTAGTLAARLTEYVDRIDTDMALEYQVQQGLAAGVAKEPIYLMPLSGRHSHGPELHANTVVLKLLTGYT